jgi:hypothetical protein
MAKEDNFYMQILAARGELSVGKITNHVLLEGNHCLAVFYAGNVVVCL